MTIITIEQAGKYDGQEVTIRGWLYNLRESGKLMFPIFRDGTGVIQGVCALKENPEAFEALKANARFYTLKGKRVSVAEPAAIKSARKASTFALHRRRLRSAVRGRSSSDERRRGVFRTEKNAPAPNRAAVSSTR